MMTERDHLLYGIEFGGELHYDVEMRLMTIQDNIAALEEVGPESGMRITDSMMRRAIVSVGAIPKEELTLDLLREQLGDDEYDVLTALQARIKKKRLRAKSASPATGNSSSSSALSESANQTSGA